MRPGGCSSCVCLPFVHPPLVERVRPPLVTVAGPWPQEVGQVAAAPALCPPRRLHCQRRLRWLMWLAPQMRRPRCLLWRTRGPRAWGEGCKALLRPLLPPSPPRRFWRQMGGHLRVVEASSQGVVWGIGYDGTAWVYTGGYGGGCFQGEGSPHPGAGRMSSRPATAFPAVPSNPSGFPAPRQSRCPSVDTQLAAS